MGRTVLQLSSKEFPDSPIFRNRFVIEICEKVHTHYKNIRLVNTIHDWVNMAEGFRDALDRWKKRGCPATSKNNHIELCRKKILSEAENGSILVNLNANLYKANEGSIFSEGADFYDDDRYIHLKIGDFRIELSIDQFRALAQAIGEADEGLKSSSLNTLL